MPKNLPDIIYDKNNITPILDSTNSYYNIPMYKDIDYLSNYENYVAFVKGIEKMVRNDDRYKKYINYLKKKVNVVLMEHQQNRVGVVMVSSTIHEAIHNGEIFINYHQAWGDIAGFVNKYNIAMTDEYKEQLNKYIDRSLLYDSTDFSVLDLNKDLKK